MIHICDLAAADPVVRISPFCWRTRTASAHMALDVDALPSRFTDRVALMARA